MCLTGEILKTLLMSDKMIACIFYFPNWFVHDCQLFLLEVGGIQVDSINRIVSTKEICQPVKIQFIKVI